MQNLPKVNNLILFPPNWVILVISQLKKFGALKFWKHCKQGHGTEQCHMKNFEWDLISLKSPDIYCLEHPEHVLMLHCHHHGIHD